MEVSHNKGTDRWLVIKKQLDASNVRFPCIAVVVVVISVRCCSCSCFDTCFIESVLTPGAKVADM